MTDVEPVVSDFAATGRTGRRNALPDILGSTAGRGADDLPNKLAELSVGGTSCAGHYLPIRQACYRVNPKSMTQLKMLDRWCIK